LLDIIIFNGKVSWFIKIFDLPKKISCSSQDIDIYIPTSDMSIFMKTLTKLTTYKNKIKKS